MLDNTRLPRAAILPTARFSIAALALAVATAALATGCEDTVLPLRIRTLERPSSISFACYGPRWVEEQEGTVTGPLPPEICGQWANLLRGLDADGPAGQEPLATQIQSGETLAPFALGFVLQRAQGSVAVTPPIQEVQLLPPFPVFVINDPVDADTLTPGINAIPMGILPVDIATHPTGCFVATANAGTCDFTFVEVESVLGPTRRPVVSRVETVDAGGETIDARPSAMVGDPRRAAIGECPAQPDNWLMYVAYPDCNAVAAIDAATGEAVASLIFAEDGTVTIGDGDLDCHNNSQCGSVVPAEGSTAPRPVALEMKIERDDDGIETSRRLYIGSENSASVTVVDLTSEYLPESSYTVALEGEVGITKLAVSDLLTYEGGDFRFVYAIATDGTIRVAEVNNLATECDTQTDTRYLHDERSTQLLPCLPVADPETPPRRVGAISPGIHVEGSAVPLDVAMGESLGTGGTATATDLTGHFAYITLSTGQLLLVNVDDQNYPDIEDLSNPFAVEISLALPHRIRDGGVARQKVWREDVTEGTVEECNFPEVSNVSFGPRIVEPPDATRFTSAVATENEFLLPTLRSVPCTNGSGAVSPIPELSFMVDNDTRRLAYPDWSSVPTEEQWSLAWEGVLFPGLKIGLASAGSDDQSFVLEDLSAPFCEFGIEVYDSVVLRGCNPDDGDAGCGINETCSFPPDATSGAGVCLPIEREAELAALCEEFRGTLRRFNVRKAEADRLELIERRRALLATPREGCTDAAQCDVLWNRKIALEPPPDPEDPPDELVPTWSCEIDENRGDTVPRCLMTCESAADCENGFACSDGYCVEGVIPPPECVASLQPYSVFGSDAFVVFGSQHGYLHNRVVDQDGQCIDDPNGHPLKVGRIPLSAPPCTGDGIEDDSPSPCSVTIDHAADNTCDVAESPRQVEALRFRNPVFTMHLVDPVSRRDLGCDAAETEVAIPLFYRGYLMTMFVVGGIQEMRLSMVARNEFTGETLVPSYPVGISEGPLGHLWVMDQGDRGGVINGQVILLPASNPFAPSAANYLQ